MIGLSGTYAINGTDLTMQPTEHNWVDRDSIGISGDGHTIYSSAREYRLVFNLQSASDMNQLVAFFNTVSTTGTIVACLPQWNSPLFTFANYSGCVLREPTFSNYFNEYAEQVTLVIGNIRT